MINLTDLPTVLAMRKEIFVLGIILGKIKISDATRPRCRVSHAAAATDRCQFSRTRSASEWLKAALICAICVRTG